MAEQISMLSPSMAGQQHMQVPTERPRDATNAGSVGYKRPRVASTILLNMGYFLIHIL